MLDPEFRSVWFSESVGIALSLNPVMLAELPVAVQVNNSLSTFDRRGINVFVLLQICSIAGKLRSKGKG